MESIINEKPFIFFVYFQIWYTIFLHGKNTKG